MSEPIMCACCGDPRVEMTAWGIGYCIDCESAGCDEITCRATGEVVAARVRAGLFSKDDGSTQPIVVNAVVPATATPRAVR